MLFVSSSEQRVGLICPCCLCADTVHVIVFWFQLSSLNSPSDKTTIDNGKHAIMINGTLVSLYKVCLCNISLMLLSWKVASPVSSCRELILEARARFTRPKPVQKRVFSRQQWTDREQIYSTCLVLIDDVVLWYNSGNWRFILLKSMIYVLNLACHRHFDMELECTVSYHEIV
jgi:hypothetical protein